MEQIELYHNETPCTSKQSKVFVEDNKVYQHTSNYLDISNKEQMLKIVERLTMEEGYLMESDNNKTIKLVNSKKPETIYYIWTNQVDMMKVTKRLVGYLE